MSFFNNLGGALGDALKDPNTLAQGAQMAGTLWQQQQGGHDQPGESEKPPAQENSEEDVKGIFSNLLDNVVKPKPPTPPPDDGFDMGDVLSFGGKLLGGGGQQQSSGGIDIGGLLAQATGGGGGGGGSGEVEPASGGGFDVGSIVSQLTGGKMNFGDMFSSLMGFVNSQSPALRNALMGMFAQKVASNPDFLTQAMGAFQGQKQGSGVTELIGKVLQVKSESAPPEQQERLSEVMAKVEANPEDPDVEEEIKQVLVE